MCWRLGCESREESGRPQGFPWLSLECFPGIFAKFAQPDKLAKVRKAWLRRIKYDKKLLLLFLFLSLFLLVPNHITAITAGEEIFSKQEEEFVKISRKRFAVVVRNNERDYLLLLRVDWHSAINFPRKVPNHATFPREVQRLSNSNKYLLHFHLPCELNSKI